MRVDSTFRVTVLAAAVLLEVQGAAGARTSGVRLCGRILSDVMSHVCRTYNSPSWDDPSVDRPSAVVRRKRDVGIADQCCNDGCTWEQLSEFCAVSSNSDSPFEAMEAHMIADRSAEERPPPTAPTAPTAPAVVAAGVAEAVGARRARSEVGRSRTRGYGRARKRGRAQSRTHARGRRCWCRRKRRAGRRRSSLMGNMRYAGVVERAAPVVGTVSPLLTWGRTLHAELPPRDHDRLAYVTV